MATIDKQCETVMLLNGVAVRCEYWDYEHVTHYAAVYFNGGWTSVRWGGSPASMARQVQRDIEAKVQGKLTHHLCAGCDCLCHDR